MACAVRAVQRTAHTDDVTDTSAAMHMDVQVSREHRDVRSDHEPGRTGAGLAGAAQARTVTGRAGGVSMGMECCF